MAKARGDESQLTRSERGVLSFGYFIGGVSVALACLQAGVSKVVIVVAALAMYSATGELAILAVLVGGGSVVAAFGSAVLVSARFGVMGTALAARFGDRPVWERAAAAACLVDPTVTVALRDADPRLARSTYWRLTASMAGAWLAGTLAGLIVGTRIGDPRVWGLDAVIPATLLAIGVSAMRTPGGRLAGNGAALLALALVRVTPAGIPILGAVAMAGLVSALQPAARTDRVASASTAIAVVLGALIIAAGGATVRFGLPPSSDTAATTDRFGIALVLAAATAIYGVRLCGMFLLAGRQVRSGLDDLLRLVPVTVVLAVVAVQTFTVGSTYVVDARVPAMAAALVALRARQHQAVVLLVAAGTAAVVRVVG